MASIKVEKPHQILRGALRRKQGRLKGYSQSAFARDWGVSSAFVTNVLTGEKAFPLDRLDRVAKILEMDPSEKDKLLRSLTLRAMKPAQLRLLNQNSAPELDAKLDHFERKIGGQFSLLKEWHHIALLNLIECEDFNPEPKAIALRLGLTETQARQSLEGLATAGCIENVDGLWKKVDRYEFIPTAKSRSEVRDFHKQMIKKAYAQLAPEKASSFEQRLITGFTVAADIENLDALKQMTLKFLADASALLSEGSCTEVYQINVQLFPLTSNGSPKR